MFRLIYIYFFITVFFGHYLYSNSLIDACNNSAECVIQNNDNVQNSDTIEETQYKSITLDDSSLENSGSIFPELIVKNKSIVDSVSGDIDKLTVMFSGSSPDLYVILDELLDYSKYDFSDLSNLKHMSSIDIVSDDTNARDTVSSLQNKVLINQRSIDTMRVNLISDETTIDHEDNVFTYHRPIEVAASKIEELYMTSGSSIKISFSDINNLYLIHNESVNNINNVNNVNYINIKGNININNIINDSESILILKGDTQGEAPPSNNSDRIIECTGDASDCINYKLYNNVTISNAESLNIQNITNIANLNLIDTNNIRIGGSGSNDFQSIYGINFLTDSKNAFINILNIDNANHSDSNDNKKIAHFTLNSSFETNNISIYIISQNTPIEINLLKVTGDSSITVQGVENSILVNNLSQPLYQIIGIYNHDNDDLFTDNIVDISKWNYENIITLHTDYSTLDNNLNIINTQSVSDQYTSKSKLIVENSYLSIISFTYFNVNLIELKSGSTLDLSGFNAEGRDTISLDGLNIGGNVILSNIPLSLNYFKHSAEVLFSLPESYLQEDSQFAFTVVQDSDITINQRLHINIIGDQWYSDVRVGDIKQIKFLYLKDTINSSNIILSYNNDNDSDDLKYKTDINIGLGYEVSLELENDYQNLLIKIEKVHELDYYANQDNKALMQNIIQLNDQSEDQFVQDVYIKLSKLKSEVSLNLALDALKPVNIVAIAGMITTVDKNIFEVLSTPDYQKGKDFVVKIDTYYVSGDGNLNLDDKAIINTTYDYYTMIYGLSISNNHWNLRLDLYNHDVNAQYHYSDIKDKANGGVVELSYKFQSFVYTAGYSYSLNKLNFNNVNYLLDLYSTSDVNIINKSYYASMQYNYTIKKSHIKSYINFMYQFLEVPKYKQTGNVIIHTQESNNQSNTLSIGAIYSYDAVIDESNSIILHPTIELSYNMVNNIYKYPTFKIDNLSFANSSELTSDKVSYKPTYVSAKYSINMSIYKAHFGISYLSNIYNKDIYNNYIYFSFAWSL